MRELRISVRSNHPLPPTSDITARSFRKIGIALTMVEQADKRQPMSTTQEIRTSRKRNEGLRLLENKFGLMEVILTEGVFRREDRQLIVDCLRALRRHATGDHRRITEALIEIARKAGLIEPRDRYGRDTFALRC